MIDKPKIYIQGKLMPASWDMVTWNEFESMLKVCNQNTNITPFEFFSGFSIEQFVNQIGIEKSELVFSFFIFLSQRPNNEYVGFDISQKSINHKLVALNFIKNCKDNPELSFPYILATYSVQDANDIEAIKFAYNKIVNDSVQSIYPKALNLFMQVCENEQNLSNNLKQFEVPADAVSKQAGIDKLQNDTHDISLIHTLANSEFLKYNEAKKQSVSEVNKFLILKQRLAHFEFNYRKIIEDKTKLLQKSKKR